MKEEETMRSYRVPMVPGPTSVPAEVLSAYQHDYASGDLEEEYFDGSTEGGERRVADSRQ